MKKSIVLRARRRALLVHSTLAAALMGFAPLATAGCEARWWFSPQDVKMNMGQVMIMPGLPLGAVIKRIEVPIHDQPFAFHCSADSTGIALGTYLQAEQLSGGVPGFDNVYPTKVEGVGIRVWRQGSSIATYYPHELPLSGSGWLGSWYSLEGGQFVIELVKTAAHTGSGQIADNSRFTTYYISGQPGRPVLTSTFTGSGTTIVHPTCEVDAGSRNIAVNFGQVPSSRFTGVGTRADDRDFAIRLTCQGSNVASQQQDISIRLDSTSAMPSRPGVIAIEDGAAAAAGIGVEVLRVTGATEAPVTFGQGLPLGRTQQGTQAFELSLRARYIQTDAGPVQPGTARATATFTIEYD